MRTEEESESKCDKFEDKVHEPTLYVFEAIEELFSLDAICNCEEKIVPENFLRIYSGSAQALGYLECYFTQEDFKTQ